MKQIIILLCIIRLITGANAQAAITVVDKVYFPSGVYISGLCQDTTGMSGVSTTNPWASECAKKYIDNKMRDTALGIAALLAGKVPATRTITINGNAQALSADRNWTLKIPSLYSGATNSSGVYTVTFGTPYAAAPAIVAVITNQSVTNQYLRVSAISTTGFTINVFSRSTLTVLGIDLLSAAAANVNGATVDVYITER